MTSNKTKNLLNRLIILEKFIELKSNECAYYRTKVHLMQMSSASSQIPMNISGKNTKRSSSEDIRVNMPRHRRNSLPKSVLKKGISHSSIRKEIDHQYNQNYYEENPSHSNRKLSLPKDKNIQCNENDFHLIESPHTILKIRLPHRFVKSLLAQKKKSSTPKLKVHLSSALLNKLFQSIHSNQNQFTIQSQFGKIAACINHENSIDYQQSKAIHARAEVKTHLPIIRHIARTRSDGSNRRKILLEKTNSRRKKRHLYKSSSSSHEESKRSSLTNITQTIGTFSSSSDPTNHSISVENIKNKRNKINIKR
jgi:hypothetical protein